MKWDLDTRRKMARLVRDLSSRIQGEEIKKARNYREVLDNTDRRLTEILKPLGFTKANRDWIPEFSEDISMFQPNRTHLWFGTVQSRVFKISKRDAEKVLVLGFL